MLELVEILFKLGCISMMIYSFKLVDDILHLPLWIIFFMATSWQIFLAIIYLLISMIWKNIIHKTDKYHLYFGIIHVNALLMTFGVTIIFWSIYILAQDLIIARSIGIPIIYLHYQHTLPWAHSVLPGVIRRRELHCAPVSASRHR